MKMKIGEDQVDGYLLTRDIAGILQTTALSSWDLFHSSWYYFLYLRQESHKTDESLKDNNPDHKPSGPICSGTSRQYPREYIPVRDQTKRIHQEESN